MLCTFAGCGYPVRAGGLCNAHDMQRRRGRELAPVARRLHGPRSCEVLGCGRRHYARGMCWTHYRRERTHGSPLAQCPIGRQGRKREICRRSHVGLTIRLKDFSADQVADLNQRHGSPLRPEEIPTLMTLVGGHPYLVRQAYYTIVSEGLSLADLLQVAISPDGPFGNHLPFYQHILKKNPVLLSAYQQLLREQKLRDESLLERLSAVGLIRHTQGKWAAPCGLYEQFFSRGAM